MLSDAGAGPLIENAAPLFGLAILALTFLAFAREVLPPSAVAVAAVSVFLASGILSIEDVVGVLATPALLTVAAMFVISGALVRTGTLEAVASFVTDHAETRPRLAVGGLLAGTLAASAFINNMPVVLVLIPVMVRVCSAIGVAPTRLLIPLSYVAVLGGTCTLIGTSTNLVVAGVAQSEGLDAFSIFEITPVGLAASGAGLLTLALLGRWLLPSRQEASGGLDGIDRSAFLTELTVGPKFDGIGTPVCELPILSPEGVRLLAVRRKKSLERDGFDKLELKEGDTLVVAASHEELIGLAEREGLSVGHGGRTFGEDAVVAEAMVAPNRRGTRQHLSEARLLNGRDISVLGINRDRHLPGPTLAGVVLRPADRIIVRGEPEAIARLGRSHDFVSLSLSQVRAFRRRKAPLAILAAVGVVAVAALGIAPIGAAAFVAVAALLLLRCIDADEAWASIDGGLLVLVFAMLAMGAGLQNAGTIDLMVGVAAPLFAAAPAFLFILGLYVLASTLTELVTNNAVAVILTPIAIMLAENAGHDPRAAAITVMMAASASFATPVGYQTNTLVYGAADYRFSDFLRIGLPMNVTVGIVSALVITLMWPSPA